ncbi:extracellular matrix protein 2-like [Dreissena polymorpha]|uniref:VWFC domain-containing protein n=1 Tax=Dreissena polymorpha TaxID=45954 RepID=A0A9D4BRN2_DREPO|nr:extracellular matrix protein 2-like [Dreissena polymorpha]KAH3702767.1 hypothetical protein DPMN_077793 [Dreissena polymorpha]
MATSRSFLAIWLICLIGIAAPCQYGGHTYQEGELVPSEDPCLFCWCTHGKILCGWMECMHCEGYTPPGQCCPICGSLEEV